MLKIITVLAFSMFMATQAEACENTARNIYVEIDGDVYVLPYKRDKTWSMVQEGLNFEVINTRVKVRRGKMLLLDEQAKSCLRCINSSLSIGGDNAYQDCVAQGRGELESKKISPRHPRAQEHTSAEQEEEVVTYLPPPSAKRQVHGHNAKTPLKSGIYFTISNVEPDKGALQITVAGSDEGVVPVVGDLSRDLHLPIDEFGCGSFQLHGQPTQEFFLMMRKGDTSLPYFMLDEKGGRFLVRSAGAGFTIADPQSLIKICIPSMHVPQ